MLRDCLPHWSLIPPFRGRIAAMVTTSLQNVFRSLQQLPAAAQDELAEHLADYPARWRELQDGIAEARDDIEYGRITEIKNIEGFVDTLRKDHGSA